MAKKKAISRVNPNPTERIDGRRGTRDTNASMVSVSQSFEGPLPPPSFLKQYEDALPGAADRILNLAEAQTNHRIKLEGRLVEGEIEDSKRSRDERRLGQWLGFAICLVAILSGATISVLGQPYAGVLIGAVGLTPLVSTFITGRKEVKPAAEKDS